MLNYNQYLNINEATLTDKSNLNKGVYFKEDGINKLLQNTKYSDIMPTDTIFDIVYISSVHYKILNNIVFIDIENSIRETSDPQLKRILYNTFQLRHERHVRSRFLEIKSNENLVVINLLQEKIINGSVRKLPQDLQTVLLRNSKNGKFLYLISDTKRALDTLSRYRLVKAEDWEKLICLSWNFIQEEYQEMSDNMEEYYDVLAKKSNVTKEFAKKFDPANSELNNKYITISDNITKELKNILYETGINPNEYIMKYSGNVGVRPTSDWIEYGSRSSQPKTDMYLAAPNKEPIKISLKKKGGSQLLSATENEIKALLNCAFDNFESNDTQLRNIDIDELFDTNLWSHFTLKNKNVREIKDEIDHIKLKLDPNWDSLSDEEKKKKIQNIEDKQVKDVMFSMINHKKLNDMMKNLIKDREFKNFVVEEALTGYYKFGEYSLGSAEYLLVFDTSNNGTIYKFEKINQRTIEEISDKIEFNISFKSYKKSADTTLRLLYKDYVKHIKPDINILPIKEMMIESYEEGINEGIFDNFFGWFKNFLNKLKDFIISIYQTSLKQFMNLFGIDFDVTIEQNYTF